MDYQVGTLDKDVILEVDGEQFSIQKLINIIIEFINKLLKFEF